MARQPGDSDLMMLLIGLVIGALFLAGTHALGGVALRRFVPDHQDPLLALGVGTIGVCQVAYLATLSPAMFDAIYLIAVAIPVLGLVAAIRPLKARGSAAIPRSWTERLALLISVLLVLCVVAPPTMADALDYHLGVPVYLLHHHAWPPTALWLHGSLVGLGEVLTTLGLTIHSNSVATLLQALSLVLFARYVSRGWTSTDRGFLQLFVLSAPVVLFLVTGPKAQLFPAVLTACALHLTVQNQRLDRQAFMLVCVLVMGAAQHKLPFNLSGGLIGLWALWKTRRPIAVLEAALLFAIFFGPRGWHNIAQTDAPTLLTFFTPLPEAFTSFLRAYRDNATPISALIPGSAGAATTVIGFAWLALLRRPDSPRQTEALALTAAGVGLTVVLGQPTARSLFEFVLWGGVALSLSPPERLAGRAVRGLVTIQALAVAALAMIFIALISIPGLINPEAVKQRSASEYTAARWVDAHLPVDAVLLSGLRSVALFDRSVVPTDWIRYPGLDRAAYYQIVRERGADVAAVVGPPQTLGPLAGCLGAQLAGPETFVRATRNPFNRGAEYTVTIYKFTGGALPDCATAPR